jgi:arylsulfatase
LGKTHFVYYDGVDRLPLRSAPELSARSHRLTATLESDGAAEGVIAALGGRHAGFTLFVKDGKLVYEANTFGQIHERIESSKPLPKGKVVITFDFDVDFSLTQAAKGLVSSALVAKARPGKARLSVNGEEVASGHFSSFGGFRAVGTETFDVGKDLGSPVSDAYASPFAFTGKIEKVEIDLK